MKYTGIIKLLTLILLTPAAIWWLALSRTVKQYGEFRRLSHEISVEHKPGSSLDDCILSKPLLSGGDIVRIADTLCSSTGCSLISYSPRAEEANGNVQLFTASLTLSGRFLELVKILDGLESSDKALRFPKVSMVLYDRMNGLPRTIRMNIELALIEYDKN